MMLKSRREFHKKYSFFNYSSIFELPKLAIFALISILSICIICLYSAAGGSIKPYAYKQILYITISAFVFFVVISINHKFWFNWAYKILFLSILSLIFIIPFGRRALGASRWIDFGFITIQPSEFAKIAVVLALAKFFSNLNSRDVKNITTIIKSFCIVVIPIALVFIQPDLATTVVIFGIFVSMIFTIGVRYFYFYFAFLLSLIASPIIWFKLLKEYQRLRIINFLFPENDPLGSGYNIIQSKIAIGSGGFTGKGFLQGTQGQLRFLPEHHTDFIFTIIGEEFGFIGAIVLIFLYLYLIYYGYSVASKTNSVFSKLTAIGCSTILFLHLFINIGMTISLMPVAGIPLLMMSYGGSSLLLGAICVALIINVDINKNIV